MLKFVLVKYLAELIAVIERISACAHHSQEGKSIIDCSRNVEYFIQCLA